MRHSGTTGLKRNVGARSKEGSNEHFQVGKGGLPPLLRDKYQLE
jgi:hypothetical protein